MVTGPMILGPESYPGEGTGPCHPSDGNDCVYLMGPGTHLLVSHSSQLPLKKKSHVSLHVLKVLTECVTAEPCMLEAGKHPERSSSVQLAT